MKNKGKVALALAVLVAAYVSAAMLAWALRHPEMTQTQNLLHFVDAMLWRSK